MTPEALLQSWDRAQYLGAVVGECNAMIVDENQFIKFIQVTNPPPPTVQIPFVPPEILRGNAFPSAKPTQHILEVRIRHHNFQGWVVYG